MSLQSPLIQRVGEVAQRLLADLTSVEQSLRDAADEGACYAELAASMDRCLRELADLNVWGPENRVPSSELWNAAGHLLERGWLENQARHKPRGYAGDYEMLAWIYEKRVCEDPLGRLLDRYFQSQAAPQAVRNRMQLMADWIVEETMLHCTEQWMTDLSCATAMYRPTPFHIAMIGSAFGLDVRDALARLAPAPRQELTVTLLDLDPAAIEFARSQLAPLLDPGRLKLAATNLFRLPERPQIAELIQPADLILCPGIFDYLNDDEAGAMLRALYARLAPGGRLTVFQFAPHNPTRAYMEWLGNWYLTYRDADQLRSLVARAGVEFQGTQFGSEALGVCLYATIWRETA